jgi:predicted oxidoreductase
MTFNLFSNRSGKSFLLNKLKNIDYVLLIHEPENKAAVESVILCLKELDTINAVFNIEVDNFKDKNLQFLTH